MKEIKDYKINENEKVVYAHQLEKLILLKRPCYPKQSTDSM